MKKILLILLFPLFAFSQNDTIIEPKTEAQTLEGFSASYFLDTTDFPNYKTWYVDANYTDRIAENGTLKAPYNTISEAITAASSGDLILVYPGNYTEHLTFVADSITLIGIGGADVTFLEATDVSSHGIDVADYTWIEGFTLTGDAAGAVIELAGGETNVTLINNVINTTGANTFGISVGANGSDSLWVLNNIFRTNTGDGAIWAQQANTEMIVDGNTFLGQDSTSGYAIQTAGINGARFTNNYIEGFASGIFPHTVTATTAGAYNILIEGNTIRDCSKGIRLGHTSQSVNQDSMLVWNNTVYYCSFGIEIANDAQVLSGTFSIVGNNLQQNTVNYRNANTAPYNLANNLDGNIAINGTLTVNDYTLPAADGTADQIISTDGSGALSFITSALGTNPILKINTSNPSAWIVYRLLDTLIYSTGHTHTELMPYEAKVYGTMGFADSAGTVNVSGSNYFLITNAFDKLYITGVNKGLTFAGDSIQVPTYGDYDIDWDLSMSGANTDEYHIEIFINGVDMKGIGEAIRDMSTTNTGVSTGHTILSLSADDWITLRISNVNNDNDPVFHAGNIRISKK